MGLKIEGSSDKIEEGERITRSLADHFSDVAKLALALLSAMSREGVRRTHQCAISVQ